MKLFEPISIGTLEIRNRLVMSAMTTGYAGADQLPSQRLIDYLVERARGGVGLITLEACVVDRRHREVPHSMHFAEDEVIAPHRALVEAVHAHGARIQPQIVHAGPDALSPQLDGIPSLGPSVIPSYLTGTPSRELAADELPAILGQYASAVRRVKAAGYDGIELHAAHGYMLLGSFLTPWRNKRTDDYAGHRREGRLRFLLEVLAAIRAEVGDGFPVTLRISGYERIAGGRTLDDTARIAPGLVAAGVDAFHVSGGVIDRLTSNIVTGAVFGDAHNLAAARALKHVVDVPVMLVGRIHEPALAEAIVQRGDADLIAMARPFLADPELPNKVRSGDVASVRRCISCQNCIDSMETGSMNCAVNGRSGREGGLSLVPAVASKRVIVVGGGPGGLEAARLSALRGHRVALYERAPYLGGALVVAATVHPENRPFLDFLLREVKRLPIEVHLNAELDATAIVALQPDAVVVATGGRVVAPCIPGDDGTNVFTGLQLRQVLAGRVDTVELERLSPGPRAALRTFGRPFARIVRPSTLRVLSKVWMPLGRHVVIVGGDLAAIELAEFLATRGRRVSVIESASRLAPEVGMKRLTEHMDRLDQLGVAVLTGVSTDAIDPRGVRIVPEGGGVRRIEADSVVIAGRLEPDLRLYESVNGVVPAAYSVGDCTGLGLVRKAIEEATRVACAL